MNSDEQNNIFMKHKVLTYEEIKQSIPKEASTKPKQDWVDLGMMEWRWRFLTLPMDRKVVEISRISSFSSHREYVKENGRWVNRKVPSVFDDYVTEEYYYYTNLE